MHAFKHPDPSAAQIAAALRRANQVALSALALGRHPFGALLLAPDHQTVLAEQGNIDTVQHAEATLLRAVAAQHAPEFLWDCTLVTTFEPCAMCAGTAYWANIGRVVYGASEEALLALTGNHAENPTLALPCRELFARGQKPVRVFGPWPELETELLAPHRGFWSDH
ncbi:nucleoside deaminase [Methylibium petroleiphilum]|uniref:nucleoside deaminase n=1 Tax=Methylibium petroleiphilum TaxID=105560 RepID=UPI001AC33A9E|nr:nucleoside deaminase [Methylibium petroleiphilum]MBN9204076.1 nucleoside deaminase [Methylibium petroleiphilum]